MELVMVGVNQNSAPAAVRDAVAMGEDEVRQLLEILRGTGNGKIETSVLSTCLRTELYARASDAAEASLHLRAALDAFKGVTHLTNGKYTYERRGRAAARHLFRVAAGLDSMMLGEHQVLGQVRDAAALAERCGTTALLLSRLFHAAAYAGIRVRNETSIARGAVSVALAAIRMARKVFGDLTRSRVLVIGAGETGQLVARHFAKERPADLVVANRTPAHARVLAETLGGRAWPFEKLQDAIRTADVVVSATSAPDPVIRVDSLAAVMQSRDSKPLVIVDIANPRDVEPKVAELPNVFLYDLDSLESIVQQHRAVRAKEVPKAERIIEDELDRFMEWYRALEVKPVIRALRHSFEEIGRQEARRHAKYFHETEREALTQFTNSLINKLLHHPTLYIRKADRSTSGGTAMLAAVQELFQLSEGDDCRGDREDTE